MKVLVCGGRTFNDREQLTRVLDKAFDYYGGFTHLIQGGASGADTMAGAWARSKGVQVVICPANWDKHGKAAGHIRNRAMLNLGPNLVIAFPGGNGTANMVRQARAAGIVVYEVEETG